MINVRNARNFMPGEYIGRPSPLGNPFIIGRDGTRDEVIAKYRSWLWYKTSIDCKARDELNRLTDLYEENGNKLDLVCWCAPKACHGDVIAQAIPWWSVAR